MEVIQAVIRELKPNCEILKQACTKELFATHAAYALVKKGMPFREAYQAVGSHLNLVDAYNPIDVIRETNHTGGPGNLNIEKKIKEVKEIAQWWKKQDILFKQTIKKLLISPQ